MWCHWSVYKLFLQLFHNLACIDTILCYLPHFYFWLLHRIQPAVQAKTHFYYSNWYSPCTPRSVMFLCSCPGTAFILLPILIILAPMLHLWNLQLFLWPKNWCLPIQCSHKINSVFPFPFFVCTPPPIQWKQPKKPFCGVPTSPTVWLPNQILIWTSDKKAHDELTQCSNLTYKWFGGIFWNSDSNSVGLVWGMRFCISNKLLAEANATDSENTL